jgi:hypothetical protein
VRFQVLTIARMKMTSSGMMMTVIWVLAPCSLVKVFRNFRGAVCLHHQGPVTVKAASTRAFEICFLPSQGFDRWWVGLPLALTGLRLFG